jgi:hypothetical protein
MVPLLFFELKFRGPTALFENAASMRETRERNNAPEMNCGWLVSDPRELVAFL